MASTITLSVARHSTSSDSNTRLIPSGTLPQSMPGNQVPPFLQNKTHQFTNGNTFPLQQQIPAGGGGYSDGMEVVWHGEFSRLFGTFYPPHIWYLTTTIQAPSHNWKQHRDSAKVRFCCQDCGNGWTSMKGRVTFWFHLDLHSNTGFLQFKLYGQQCKKCNSGKFEYVMWYPEEVSKVLCNVYNKVGQTYYGFQQPPIRVDRRPGRPRHQHNSDLCQACRDGECDQARSGSGPIYLNGLVHQASLSTSVSQDEPPSPSSQTSPSVGDRVSSNYIISDFPPNSPNAKSEDDATPQTSPSLSGDSSVNQEVVENETGRKKDANKNNSVKKSASSSPSISTSGVQIAPLNPGNSQFFYHPAPMNHFVPGMTPFYPQAVFPFYAQYSTINHMPIPLPPQVSTITEMLSSTVLADEQIDNEQQSKMVQLSD